MDRIERKLAHYMGRPPEKYLDSMDSVWFIIMFMEDRRVSSDILVYTEPGMHGVRFHKDDVTLGQVVSVHVRDAICRAALQVFDRWAEVKKAEALVFMEDYPFLAPLRQDVEMSIAEVYQHVAHSVRYELHKDPETGEVQVLITVSIEEEVSSDQFMEYLERLDDWWVDTNRDEQARGLLSICYER